MAPSQPFAPGENTFAPQTGAAFRAMGASCNLLSPPSSCQSRDANVPSATRFLLSAHNFVVFIDLLGKKKYTTFMLPRQFVMVRGVVIYLYLALCFRNSHGVARTSFSI